MIQRYKESIEALNSKYFGGDDRKRVANLASSYSTLSAGMFLPEESVYNWLKDEMLVVSRSRAVYMENLSGVISRLPNTSHDRICYQLFLDTLAQRVDGKFANAYHAEAMLSNPKETQSLFLEAKLVNSSPEDVAAAIFLALSAWGGGKPFIIETAAVIADCYLMSEGVGSFCVLGRDASELAAQLNYWCFGYNSVSFTAPMAVTISDYIKDRAIIKF